MAIPNETSVLSGNGGTLTPSTKKKAAKKPAAPSSRTPAPAQTKETSTRSSAPIETLFTQEPNPYRPTEPPFIWIDYPTQNETLRNSAYVVRLGVGGADLVEISIDKSPWLPCRLTSGYWWYDWSKISRGKHTLTARMRTTDGRWFKTPVRQCDNRVE